MKGDISSFRKYLLSIDREDAIDLWLECLARDNIECDSWKLMNEIHGSNWQVRVGHVREFVEKSIYELETAKRVNIQKNQVFQLHPKLTRNQMFAACLFIVTEPKYFGALGYVQSLGINGRPGGQAYYRATFEELVPLENGLCPFILEEKQ
jgi:hypothetical protein